MPKSLLLFSFLVIQTHGFLVPFARFTRVSLARSRTVSSHRMVSAVDNDSVIQVLPMVVNEGTETSATPAFLEDDYYDAASSTLDYLEQDKVPLFQPEQEQHSLSFLTAPSTEVGRVMVIAAAAICGTNYAAVKLLNAAMPLACSQALRFSLAAGVVTAVVLMQEETATAKKVDWMQQRDRIAAMLRGMEVGGWYCAGYLCQALGLQTADASKSAFFNALAVIIVPLLDSFFKGKQMGSATLGSVGLALAGVALLQFGPTFGHVEATTSMTSGDLLSLFQALFFGVGYWRLESASVSHPNQAGRITAGQLLGVAVGAILFCLASGDVPSAEQLSLYLSNGFIVKALIWTGLVSTALAMYLETVALKVVSASELTILFTSSSLWASAFAYLTMGEALSPIGMIGGLLILSGCVFSTNQKQESAVSES